jgi:hypothetical protein
MSPSIQSLNNHNHHNHLASTNGHVRLSNGVVKKQPGFGTRAVHVGSDPSEETGAVIPPISLSTTYKQSGIGIHKVRTVCFDGLKAYSLCFLFCRVLNTLDRATQIEMLSKVCLRH